jgi:hypothetical protein
VTARAPDWTAAEDAILERLMGERRSLSRIAAALPGRSVVAVGARLTAKRAAAASAAVRVPPPPPIDWGAAKAAQDAKPAHQKWPYPKPAIVERAPMPSRPATLSARVASC